MFIVVQILWPIISTGDRLNTDERENKFKQVRFLPYDFIIEKDCSCVIFARFWP